MEQNVVSNENKELAKYITAIVGINRTIQRHWDEKNENCMDIFTCDDPIDSKVKFYGTIGLSDYPNIIEMKNGNKNIPVELLMAGYKNYDKIPNILSTCAFYISKNKWNCQPGSIFMRMVDFYYKKEMQHIIFVSPFIWENKLEPLKLETKTVNWLLAVPISELEMKYKNEKGFDNFQSLFGDNDVDIFDLDRKSFIKSGEENTDKNKDYDYENQNK
jgi:hypothetical protein